MSMNSIRVIDPGWPWDDGLSFVPGVCVGSTLYVSGQLPVDANGALVGPEDMEAQARCIFENIEKILHVAGASLDDVVKLTCYCTDFKDYAAYSKVRGEKFTKRFTASTTVGVPSLLVPGALLEVDAIALVQNPVASDGRSNKPHGQI
ncbi:MAG: RidA family protein [Rhizobiaceae bacterium]|nr:RidA family protein [Rhizobiaceae bacterium]